MRAQRLRVLDQVEGGAARRQHQRQRLLVGACARLERNAGAPVVGFAQQPVGVVEVGVVPGGERVADADHLAVRWRSRERDRVQVVDHDPAPCAGGLLSVRVRAQAGRRHLPQLLQRRGGEPAGRVAELLDLRRQRAAARAVGFRAGDLHHLAERGPAEPVPFDRGVSPGLVVVEHLAVLHERERVDQDLRHVGEARVGVLGEAGVEEGPAIAPQDLQACPGLLGVDRVDAPVLEPDQPLGMARLAVDAEPVRREAGHEVGDPGVAEPLVERAAGREADARAGAGTDLEASLACDARQLTRLEGRGADLARHRPDQRGGHHQQQDGRQPARARPPALPGAQVGDLRARRFGFRGAGEGRGRLHRFASGLQTRLGRR